MVAGVEDAVVLPDQLLARVLADGAEFVVHIRNRALHIGYRHDGVLIESKFLVGQLLERILAGGEALPY